MKKDNVSSFDRNCFARIRGIIFDCDGVILNSYKANMRYFNMFKESFGLPPMDDGEERFVHAASVFESLRHILPEQDWDEVLACREKIKYTDIIPHLEPMPGLYETLDWLKEQGYLLGINTNRTDTMELVNERFGLLRYFDPIINSTKVSHPKPHPEGVYKILKAWDVSPGDVVYIGDTHVDQATSHHAGVRFWAFDDNFLDADLHVRNFSSLLEWLKKAQTEK